MLGSLVWAMADLWPGEPLSVAWSADVFVQPLQTLGLGLLLSVVFGVALAKFIPKGWVWDKMVVESAIGGAAQVGGGAPDAAVALASLVGRQGVAVTMLRPSGQVEIEGRRYEAKSEIGIVDSGDVIVVRGRSDFGLIVEKAKL
jgi:membrane-bound serine protease (ClpP class)